VTQKGLKIVGVDAERIERTVSVELLARHKFASAEAALVLGCTGALQRRRFFDVWTLKETYIKARGMGLAIPLDQFAFVFDDQAATVRFATEPALNDDPSRWRFRLWSLDDAWVLALAARTEQLTVRAMAGCPGAAFAEVDLKARSSGG
jgi:4'-phosphopantetheinyl transferase